MELYRCYLCGKRKPPTEFFKDKTRTGGVGSRCKDCARAYERTRHRDRKEYYREYERKTERDKLAHNAKSKVWYAIETGKLERLVCQECGKDLGEAHHEDYNKPLEVVFLCRSCHKLLHNARKK